RSLGLAGRELFFFLTPLWLTAPLSFPNIRTFIERLGASVALRTPYPCGAFLVRIFQYATQGAYVLHSRED
ncbi:hypothetical protein WI666_03230, partial [Vibrio cholerae]